MLSQASGQEILRGINAEIGFPVKEENLTPGTRQAITNLATVQKHLSVVTELLRGEQNRVDHSLVLRAASRLGKDSEGAGRAVLSDEIVKLQLEIGKRTEDLSRQILVEEEARRTGVPASEHKGELGAVELKCPECGASLPLPTGRFVRCNYCNATLSIQDVSSQISSLIEKI